MFSKRSIPFPFAVLLFAVLVFLTGCNKPAPSKPAEKPAEKTVAQAANIPQKVIVYDLATLDTLKALGVSVAGVPGFTYPPVLKEFESDQYRKVGSLFEPDYEAVNAMNPDLILVGGRSAPKEADLAKIARTMNLSVDEKHFTESAVKNIRTLAKIFNKGAEAETKIAALEKAIDGLKKKTTQKGNGLIILTTGGKISAYGPGSRFGVIHDEYGIPAAVSDLSQGNHGQPVSFEFIRQTDPDWLFVIDRDAAIGKEGVSAKQLLDNSLIHNTKAWKNKHVIYLDPVDWYLIGGGLEAMQRKVDTLSALFDEKN